MAFCKQLENKSHNKQVLSFEDTLDFYSQSIYDIIRRFDDIDWVLDIFFPLFRRLISDGSRNGKAKYVGVYITILKWYDFHKAWIWSRFFKALKCGSGRWRRNLLEFLVSQKENNVPWSHTHKRGHKSLVKRQKAFISNCGQATFPRRFVNCLLSIFRIDFLHFSIGYYNPLVHEPGSNHVNRTWGQTGTEAGTKTGQKLIPAWITW